MKLAQNLQLLLQIGSHSHHIFQESFLFDDRQVFEGDARSQRTASKRCSMLSGGNRGSKFLFRQKCTQRQARGYRFGDRDDVRRYTERLKSKDGSGTAEAALDLIEDQGRPMTVGQSSALLKKFHRAFIITAFAEDGLEHNGTSVVVDGLALGFKIIARDEFDVFEERFESLAIFVLPGERHGAESSSVIRTLEGDQLALG